MAAAIGRAVICVVIVTGASLMAQQREGDPANGKALIESSKCLDCHRIGQQGSRLGPDLSDIGSRRTAEELRRSIMTPNAEVLAEHRFVRVVPKDGTAVIGRLLNQDAFSIQLMNADEQLKSYLKSSLREHTILEKGLNALYVFSLPDSIQATASWRELFNGKDLTGWSTGTAGWKVENGVIVGGQGGGRGSLVSRDLYKDFELELDFMLAEQPPAADGSCSTCTYNSGVYLRTGYQVNFGRREAGEFIGVVVHRVHPKAIRGNVLWLDTGDEKFPSLRKKEDWNHIHISFKGPRLQVTLNGTKICDVTDDPTDPAEARWKEPGPISFQWPPAGEAGGFSGFVKLRNIRIREI